MKIRKEFEKEIIEYETIDQYNYVKKYYTKDGILKKQKKLNVNTSKVNRSYQTSANKALESMVYMNEYKVIEE